MSLQTQWCRIAVAVTLAGVMSTFGVARAAAIRLISLTIDSVPGQTVFGDGLNSTDFDRYKDYRLTTAVTDPNHCVEASPSSTGLLFVRLNRKLDGDAGFMYCGLYESAATPRQFTVHITDQDACADLLANGYATAASDGGCDFTGQEKPRIRFDNLYGKKPSKTPVGFLSEFYANPNGISYEVRTDVDAPITLVSATVRQVKYSGTAHVVKFPGGTSKPFPVGGAFGLPFQMTFTVN